MLPNPIKEIVTLQKKGLAYGMFSICSSNPLVIEAALRRGLELNSYVVIEATANQVNQEGGYTGMTPRKFRDYVHSIAKNLGFPTNKIILGGDHLGPLTWKHLPEEKAMKKAKRLINDFVQAGFSKIHVDTSMKLADDSDGKLETSIIAKRSCELIKVAERAFNSLDSPAYEIGYIIGSEVPVPGGAHEDEEDIEVTKVVDFQKTVKIFKEALERNHLESALKRIHGIVVQPGVEFSDDQIHEYNPVEAKKLMKAIKAYPNLIFEGHSTDYQNRTKLRKLVEDGVGILKVGPALTFALREILFDLESIEKEMYAHQYNRLSNFKNILEEAMVTNPENWQEHYHGDEHDKEFARKYSFSDRARYYLMEPEVEKSMKILFDNLGDDIPLSLLSQFVPIQYQKVRQGKLNATGRDIAIDGIIEVINEYYYAIYPKTLKSLKMS